MDNTELIFATGDAALLGIFCLVLGRSIRSKTAQTSILMFGGLALYAWSAMMFLSIPAVITGGMTSKVLYDACRSMYVIIGLTFVLKTLLLKVAGKPERATSQPPAGGED